MGKGLKVAIAGIMGELMALEGAVDQALGLLGAGAHLG